MYGCGDAVIGVNPATDSAGRRCSLLHLIDDVIRARYEIPTQSCVLAHVTTQIQRDARGRADRPRVPVDRRHGGGQQRLRRDLALLDEAHQAGAR